MPADLATRRAAFRRLHAEGFFILPNPWDVGGVLLLQKLGFKAVASTSAGMAWAMGLKDGEVGVDDVLAHLTMLVEASDLPVNADFEAGFADDPEGVAKNVGRAVATGVAGLSIEDRTGPALYDKPLAIERMKAARQAIDRTGEDVILVGRCEAYLAGQKDLSLTIDRLVAYAEAGADCLYAPGIRTREEVAAVVKAVAPKPYNMLLSFTELSVPELADLGVRRVSVGGSLAAQTLARFNELATMLRDQGRLPPRPKA